MCRGVDPCRRSAGIQSIDSARHEKREDPAASQHDEPDWLRAQKSDDDWFITTRCQIEELEISSRYRRSWFCVLLSRYCILYLLYARCARLPPETPTIDRQHARRIYMLCRFDGCVAHTAANTSLPWAPPSGKVRQHHGTFVPCCHKCDRGVGLCSNSRGEEHIVVEQILPFAHLDEMDKPLTFLELGAFDGLHASNTLHLEHCLGWRGLLIEPHPDAFDRLALNRPRAWSLGTAVSNACAGDTVRFSRYSAPTSKIRQTRGGGKNGSTVEIPCMPLSKPLRLLGIRQLAVAFIDVEDSELAVISSIDWARLEVAIIVVEERGTLINKNRRVDADRVRQTLRAAGLTQVLTSCMRDGLCNAFFVHPKWVYVSTLMASLAKWGGGQPQKQPQPPQSQQQSQTHVRTVVQSTDTFAKSCPTNKVSKYKWRWWPRMCLRGMATDDNKHNGTQPLCKQLFWRRLGLPAPPGGHSHAGGAPEPPFVPAVAGRSQRWPRD